VDAGLVERFKSEATRVGVAVCEAADAESAADYVLGVVRERGVERAVTSRSPLFDAMGLRQRLEAQGVTVISTELGEWLADLASRKTGDTATTDVERLAALLSETTGEEVPPQPGALARAARCVLRRCYVEADMGISEAGIGIAGTGTTVLVGNEGNERLVAVLPRIYLTLLDVANVVSTLDDASARLRVLAETVTYGHMPTYVTYVTGRNTTGAIPGALMATAQGPEEEHIVLVGGEASP